MKIKIVFLFFVYWFSSAGYAHQTSHGQIKLHQNGSVLSGVWNIAIDDLQRSEGLDVNGNGELTWGELTEKQDLINALAKTHLKIHQGTNECVLSTDNIMLENLNTGLYVYLPIKFLCPNKIQKLLISYDFLFAFDAQHKAILNIEFNENAQTIVFSRTNKTFKYDSNKSNKLQTFFNFILEGVWHIWIGIDHILFLLSLLLPAALVLRDGEWHEIRELKPTLINTAKIVTAFTLAHSVTLGLSVLGLSVFGWVFISSRIVESVIAASVIVAALNNIKPIVHQRLWLLTFCFGLIHGMGFASVLNDVGLPTGLEGLALIGFNLGVEFGQLAIVMLVLPLIYILSFLGAYRKIIMPIGSLVIAGIALVWFIERAVEIEILSWI